MITPEQYKNMWTGQIVQYGIYKDVMFIGDDGRHTIMKDRHGNEKRVYKELFMKHARFSHNKAVPVDRKK